MRSRSTILAWLRLSFAVVAFVIGGTSVSVYAQKELSIAEIQGNSVKSSYANQSVRTKGIVTAISKRGFYLQTPDADADKDPKTSEGIYVFGSESVDAVSIGYLVQVDGTVSEYVPKNEAAYFSITELTRPTVKVISKDNPLPAPIVLTSAELDPKGKLDQMERFEGMRVWADIVVVVPTGGYPPNAKTGLSTSNGVFFASLIDAPRPLREPGIEILTKLMEKLPAQTPAFDMNPEVLRVDSDGLNGAKVLDIPAGATIKGLTGVVDYYKGFYTVLIDADPAPTVENIKGFVPVSAAGEREVTIGSFNIENFFDDEDNSKTVVKEAILPKAVFQNRLNKVSLAIRNVLSMPDVLGIVEVENLKVMQKIAAKISADAVAADQPDPKYVAYLENGNDVRGINVGFLVKPGKIKVIETKQLAADIKMNYPGGSPDEKLFDRPPLMLRAEVLDTKTEKPLAFTVIVNHFKSYRGINDPKDGDRVRNKRRLEAEWLAKWVEDREKADPAERLIICGDFNAFQFNDGYNDLIGILKGKSDPDVITPSKTAFNTGLANLIEYIDQKNRYSYVYDGTAQAIDHILINRPVRERLAKFGYARVDADFPLVWGNDPLRPERVSDHDAPVLFLKLDEPPAAKPTP